MEIVRKKEDKGKRVCLELCKFVTMKMIYKCTKFSDKERERERDDINVSFNIWILVSKFELFLSYKLIKENKNLFNLCVW